MVVMGIGNAEGTAEGLPEAVWVDADEIAWLVEVAGRAPLIGCGH